MEMVLTHGNRTLKPNQEKKVNGGDYPAFQCATYCLYKMGGKAKEHGGHTATSISHQALSSAFNLLCGIEPTQRGRGQIALRYQPEKCQYLLSGMYSALLPGPAGSFACWGTPDWLKNLAYVNSVVYDTCFSAKVIRRPCWFSINSHTKSIWSTARSLESLQDLHVSGANVTDLSVNGISPVFLGSRRIFYQINQPVQTVQLDFLGYRSLTQVVGSVVSRSAGLRFHFHQIII